MKRGEDIFDALDDCRENLLHFLSLFLQLWVVSFGRKFHKFSGDPTIFLRFDSSSFVQRLCPLVYSNNKRPDMYCFGGDCYIYSSTREHVVSYLVETNIENEM